MNPATIRITRRQAEDIIWEKIRPEPAQDRHFDGVHWDTHNIGFAFHWDGDPGEVKVSVFRKGSGEVEVIH